MMCLYARYLQMRNYAMSSRNSEAKLYYFGIMRLLYNRLCAQRVRHSKIGYSPLRKRIGMRRLKIAVHRYRKSQELTKQNNK